MATPIRKKRNFKALALDVAKQPEAPPPPAPPQLDSEPIPTRTAPAAGGAGGRRRPKPMTLVPLAPPATKDLSTPFTDGNLLVVSNTPNSAPVTGSVSATRPGYHNDLTQKLASIDMNAETKYDLRNEDLKELQELGQGNGGSVKKVEHTPSGKIMAKKVSTLEN